MFFKNLRIRARLLISFCVVIVFSIVLAVTGTLTIRNVGDNYTYIQAWPSKCLDHLRAIETEFMAMRYRAANCVMNSGDLEFINNTALKQYNTARESLLNHLNEYIRLNNNDGRQESELIKQNEGYANQLKAYLDEYEQYTQKVAELSIAGEMKLADDSLKEAIPVTGEINSLLEDMIASLEDYVENLTESTLKSEEAATLFLVGLAIVLVIFAVILAFSIGNSISKSIVGLGKAAKDIASGNLNASLSVNRNDEIGDLTRDLGVVKDTINNLITSMNTLAEELKKGDTDARINTSSFKGAYYDVADGVNALAENLINDTLGMLNVLSEFGNGNFNINLPKMPGKKAIINTVADGISHNLKSVTSEIGSLVSSASKGNLSNRIETGMYKGDWAVIMDELNKLMESVAAPIREASDVMACVAEGNFSNRVNGNYQGDFLNIKNSINNTVANIATYISEISQVLEGIAGKDLNQSITREYVGEFSNIKNALNNITDTLSRIIQDILSAAEQVSAGAKQISESSMTLATGATEQASSVEELNATILTINQNTAKNAENSKEAERLSETSKSSATKGDMDMNNMLNAMNGIKESSNSIAKIIKVIDDIAFQTNLLALNAAVEAARAGQQGKGFAVVAEEVRNLAARSQNAAQETSGLIEESINRVNEGSKIALETASALRTIVDNVTKVSGIISNIASASNEQTAAINQVTDGVSQIAEVVQNNSATSEESASASQQLSSQAEMLESLVGEFKLKKYNH